ncbi:sensor histidine kinase [Nocardioides ganghwensis]|uniref:histidine kinase n=1 Tax=Nocardioides ganghwensis TaxID=252230 RepID=A0A4Q2S785_9ACTN|nr:HAMP domain-containing sensor histidine kinase [Nocardioides ganghwensis]MBD3947979.1 HAMP domain-containing histidine kinase [Nocardioides ganghwensis]RYB97545.1 HAMP domain-containing histidine kinase [Nocardioides ganghwensis]
MPVHRHRQIGDLAVIDHPALQDASATGPTSPAATGLAISLLAGAIGVDEAVDLVARHLLTYERVDVVTSVLTRFQPEDTREWKGLGGRAWIREWAAPGAEVSVVPPPEAGPEAALTMPWLSRLARTGQVVVMVDRELLPDDAAQDRTELARIDIRSFLTASLLTRGDMYGSLSAASSEAGPWPDALVQDFKLLSAAIISRLALEQSRRSLAEAIEAGTEAQVAYQHFFGSVGHELRTPLSAILGYTEVLVDEAGQTPEDPVSSGVLRDGPVMMRACERVLDVVDSLLGAGRTLSSDDERQDVLVGDAVADVAHWHRTPAQTAAVELYIDVDPAATVRAHPSGVRQVLTSLVGNAIAHHHPHGGTVDLSTQRLLGESGQEMVRIIVRDNGPGLTPEQLEHVFEPFVRYAGPEVPGSGLGLSMARTIAERDGGAVRGESTPGAGSSFWVELPVRDPS